MNLLRIRFDSYHDWNTIRHQNISLVTPIQPTQRYFDCFIPVHPVGNVEHMLLGQNSKSRSKTVSAFWHEELFL
jgi:hypothetical protein